jgi:tetratricopeptide (TPR) repeat protein
LLRRAFGALCVLFFATTFSAAAEFDVSLRDMQTLLRDKDFDALEQRLAALEQAYAEGKISDLLVHRGYTSFAAADPTFDDLLEAWIAAKPESHRPFIAHGYFHRNLGWLYRGGRFASETSDKRIDLMRENFSIAEDNLERALHLQPHTGVAYAGLINMNMAAGSRDTINRLFREGVDADPNSFTVRRSIWNAMLPWWGGYRQDPRIFGIDGPLPDTAELGYPIKIPEAMLRFGQFINNNPNSSPHLAPLRGFTDYAVAIILRRDNRELEAAKFFKRAMTHGEYWFFHSNEGSNFSRMKRYNDAIASYTKSLEIWPDNPDVLERRAQAYRSLKAYDKALADADEALALDPRDPDLLLLKANTLWGDGKFKAAVRVLDDAILYGSLNDDIWDARGRLYLHRLKNFKRAAADFKRATELVPTNHKYWYSYASALFRAIDCETVPAYKTYLEVCKKYGNDCFDEGVKYAREVTQHLVDSGKC